MLHSSQPYHRRPRNACLLVCSSTAYHYREARTTEGTKREEAEAEQRASAKTAEHHEPNNRGFSEPTRLDHGKDPQTLPPSLSHSRTRSSLSQLTQPSSDHSLFFAQLNHFGPEPGPHRRPGAVSPQKHLNLRSLSAYSLFGLDSLLLNYLSSRHGHPAITANLSSSVFCLLLPLTRTGVCSFCHFCFPK